MAFLRIVELYSRTFMVKLKTSMTIIDMSLYYACCHPCFNKTIIFQRQVCTKESLYKTKEKEKMDEYGFLVFGKNSFAMLPLNNIFTFITGCYCFLLEQKIQSNPLSLDRSHLLITYFVIGLRSYISVIAFSNNDKQFVQD